MRRGSIRFGSALAKTVLNRTPFSLVRFGSVRTVLKAKTELNRTPFSRFGSIRVNSVLGLLGLQLFIYLFYISSFLFNLLTTAIVIGSIGLHISPYNGINLQG